MIVCPKAPAAGGGRGVIYIRKTDRIAKIGNIAEVIHAYDLHILLLHKSILRLCIMLLMP